MDKFSTTPTTRMKAAVPSRTVGYIVGAPKAILRLEGAAVLAAAAIAYAQIGSGWALFAALFLVPDVSMLGYLRSRGMGAAIYNLGHSYLVPALVLAWGLSASESPAVSVGLIWIAHIGFDRFIGYGLKYDTAFGHTHLGEVGNKPRG